MALLTSIVAYWKLDEASGNASDATGNGFTLTNNNSATYGTALINNGVDLGSANTNKSLSTTSTLGMTSSTNFTYNVWVKLNTEITSGAYFIFNKECNTNRNQNLMRYEFNGGTRRLLFDRNLGGVTDDSFSFNTTLGTSLWHMLTFTWNGTTSTMYLDGSSVATLSSSATGSGSGYTDITCVGVNDDLSSNPASAKFDEIGVWSRALTSTEVTQLYNAGAGLQYPFTVASATHNFGTMGVGS